MDKNNILISSLNVENISPKELSGTSSIDLIKRDDFDKLVSKVEVSFNEKEGNKIFSILVIAKSKPVKTSSSRLSASSLNNAG